jgi:H+-transporting ATPase
MTGDGVNDAPALKKANVGIAVEGCTDAARSAADIVLLASGLSTIVDGIKCSRAIFQRMRSYALYRISSTIHFLLFFFLSILAFDFILPNRLILMIAVLNDAATLVIAIDNARISKRPDKWRLGQLMTLSFILGFLLMVISFAHFFVLKSYFDATEEPLMAYRKLQTAMYLQISSCPHFVIFSTRVTTWWWKNKPSFTFLASIIGTQIVAMFMAVYGWKGVEAYPIGWTLGAGIMAISLVAFMFLDIIKVVVIRNWSFELTATVCPTPKRRKELKRRKARAVAMTRINRNFEKLRKCCRVIYASVLLRGRGQETITPPTEKV